MNCLQADAIDVVLHGNHHEFGVECFFYVLDKLHGVKMWCTLAEANENYEAQKRAADLGLAPPVVGNVFTVQDGDYGFITRSAKVLCKRKWPIPTWVTEEMNSGIFQNAQMLEDKGELPEGYTELGRLLHNNGFWVGDLHAFNCGIYEGKLVCIDLDYDSDIKAYL